MGKVKLLLIAMLCIVSSLSFSQVTTSSMAGSVSDGKETLAGATVVAVHEESGTRYGEVTNVNGRFSIQGMRTGGPYRVEISYIGYNKNIQKDIYLQLGETYNLDVVLTESGSELSEVVVTAVGSKFAGDRKGSVTNINSRQMAMIPTLNRSLSDYTKLSPYASGSGSFGGRPAYATNITVDGANFNNNFGLSANSMPGPSASSGDPISMESIEEMQVVVAPYDVRQSNFTGAGVNVVTKSGTNEFKGTAYGYFRNQDFNGKKIRDNELEVTDSERQVYGLSLGGPIIKNKLFFFVSGEIENNLTPGNTLLAQDAGRDPDDPNVSTRVKASDMQYFSNLLKNKFGYETGRYEKWGGDNDGSRKLLAKLDWNLSQNHKFTARYNYSQSQSTSRPSSSGDARPSISGSRHSRTGGMSFENSQYRSTGTLHSLTGELNSRFSQKFSNKLLVAYTSYDQPRETDSSMFPFIDILNNERDANGNLTGAVLMSAGMELFTYQNAVKNNTLIVTDNMSFHLGNHTITGGLSYENQYISNSYVRQGSGYYRFKDINAFERYVNGEGTGKPFNENYHPVNFAFSYPINGNTESNAELTFGQFSAYMQDEWAINKGFRMTYGLRVDLPIYLDGAVDNPALHDYAFRDGEKVDLSSWPESRLLWSPRLGFNWDVMEDKSVKVRGGVGIFTGRIPFVWFVNQPQNSGMLQYQLVVNQTGGAASRDQLARIPFAPNAYDLLKDPAIADIFPQKNAVGGRIACIDKNFKLPQVLRTSLATDIRMPMDMTLTLEGMITKDINAIRFDNINMADAASKLTEGDLQRNYWTNSANATKYVTSPYTDVVVMKNTDKGLGYAFSAQLALPRTSGFSGMVSYTYTYAEEVTGKNGSDPFSAWQYRHIVQSLNSEELGLTMDNSPHRLIASLDYQVEYSKHFASTFSFFYTGYQGGAFSYIYSNDANKDGTTSDLMYIPREKNDVIWLNGDADANAYFAFAANDPYLSKHAGQYAERYAGYEPWYNRLDFRFLQDFKFRVGKRENKVQFSLDVINLPNLFNSNWGINKMYIGSNRQVTPLKFEKRDEATGKAVVSMNKLNGEYMTTAFQDPTSVSSTWSMQLGLRYIF